MLRLKQVVLLFSGINLPLPEEIFSQSRKTEL